MLTNGTFSNGCLFLVVRPRRLSVTEWPAAPAAPAPEEATQRQVPSRVLDENHERATRRRPRTISAITTWAMFNSNKTRTTPATLDRCRGNNRVGNLADVSIRAEELERFVEPWPMRDAGLVVADRGRGQARDASLLGYSHTCGSLREREPSRGTRSSMPRDRDDDRLCGIA